jgi:NarL family two-component system response regulator YdfI
VRAGLESLLRAAGGIIDIVGLSADRAELRQLLDGTTVAVVLADLDGREPLAHLPLHDAAFVILTDRTDPDATAEAFRAGARAVLNRAAAGDEIAAAVIAAAAGLAVLHPDAVGALLPAERAAVQGALQEELTPREAEVLALLADGLGNKAIARRLGISEHTAKFHVASILGKLGVRTRTEAVALGMRLGLILL